MNRVLDSIATDDPALTPPGTTDLQAEWRGRVSSNTWRSALDRIEYWLQETFDITLSSFRVGVGDRSLVTPPAETNFLIAQGSSLDGQQAWTVFTAPGAKDLAYGAAQITTPNLWRRISGRVTTLDSTTGELNVTPVTSFTFVASSALTPRNLRLIAANWLSENIATYALPIGASCLLLGISTAILLRRVGRNR